MRNKETRNGTEQAELREHERRGEAEPEPQRETPRERKRPEGREIPANNAGPVQQPCAIFAFVRLIVAPSLSLLVSPSLLASPCRPLALCLRLCLYLLISLPLCLPAISLPLGSLPSYYRLLSISGFLAPPPRSTSPFLFPSLSLSHCPSPSLSLPPSVCPSVITSLAVFLWVCDVNNALSAYVSSLPLCRFPRASFCEHLCLCLCLCLSPSLSVDRCSVPLLQSLKPCINVSVWPTTPQREWREKEDKGARPDVRGRGSISRRGREGDRPWRMKKTNNYGHCEDRIRDLGIMRPTRYRLR